MKKIMAFLLAAALLCGAIPFTASAAGVDITDKFTDPAFLAAVREETGKPSGPILDTDVAGIASLDISGWDIESLAGLDCFTGLLSLDCYGNQLAALPALPPALVRLYCESNQLAALPALPPTLEILSCYNNKLAALHALPPALKELYCDLNQLTALPALPAGLRVLKCSANWLTGLDVTGLALERLNCSNNYMTGKSAVKGFTGAWDGMDFIYDPQRKPPSKPKPRIFTTKYKSNFGNWLLFLFCFGFIWMWF